MGSLSSARTTRSGRGCSAVPAAGFPHMDGSAILAAQAGAVFFHEGYSAILAARVISVLWSYWTYMFSDSVCSAVLAAWYRAIFPHRSPGTILAGGRRAWL